MSPPTDPRPVLSAENTDRLARALRLSRELQVPTLDADAKLAGLRRLLDECRDGIRRQKPTHGRARLEAVNQARNYLHFLPNIGHPQGPGRLRSVSRRLRRAMRVD